MPRHSDFEEIYQNFIEQYGEEKGEEYYHAWLNKHGYDDTKPMEGQKSRAREKSFDELFQELWSRMRASALKFYDEWLNWHGLDDSVPLWVQKAGFFVKGEQLHIVNQFRGADFEKLDTEEEIIVAGYATTPVTDSQGDKFPIEWIRGAVDGYNYGGVFYCHGIHEPCGRILKEPIVSKDGKTHVTCVDDVGWYVVSTPSKARPDVGILIEEGLLKGYSIGGSYVINSLGKIVGIKMWDLSYVPRASNPLSYHGIIKQDDDRRRGSPRDEREKAVCEKFGIDIEEKEKNMEKEEIEALITEKLEGIIDEINDGLEEFRNSIDAKITEELEGVMNSFSQRMDEFAKSEELLEIKEQLEEFEDLPFVKGLGAKPREGLSNYRESIQKAKDPLLEAERIARRLST